MRRRRDPEAARAEILAAAEQLVFEQGPQGLKIKAVAQAAGMTHPTILHHFGSASGLLQALQQHFSRQIRESFVNALHDSPPGPEKWLSLLKKLSDPKLGRMLCHLIAEGVDPFPPVEEGGLKQILKLLPGADETHKSRMVLTVLYAMYGEAIFGSMLRERMGVEHSEAEQDAYQKWLLGLFS